MTRNEPTAEQWARFGQYIAAAMGGEEEWAPDVMVEDFTMAARTILHEDVSGDGVADMRAELARWRAIGDRVGVQYGESLDELFPADDEDEDEDDELEAGTRVHVLSGVVALGPQAGDRLATVSAEPADVAGWVRVDVDGGPTGVDVPAPYLARVEDGE